MVSWNVKWNYVYEWKWKHWLWWTSYSHYIVIRSWKVHPQVLFPFGKLHVAVCGQCCCRWLLTFLDQLVLCCLSLTADFKTSVGLLPALKGLFTSRGQCCSTDEGERYHLHPSRYLSSLFHSLPVSCSYGITFPSILTLRGREVLDDYYTIVHIYFLPQIQQTLGLLSNCKLKYCIWLHLI